MTDHPSGNADQHLFDQELERFEEAWASGEPPDIKPFLTTAPESIRGALLFELVRIDLERRWRGFGPERSEAVDAQKFPQTPLVEDYLQRFGDRLPAESRDDLVVDEFEVRRRWGDSPSSESVLQRFPAIADSERWTRIVELEQTVLQPAEHSPVVADGVMRGHQRTNEALKPRTTPDSIKVSAERGAESAVFSQTLEPGVLIDRYQLLSKLGEGGFGVVYLASHKSFPNRRYALKLVRPDRVASPEMSSRFAREIQAMGDLNHPNIVYATDAGEWQGLQYLAMDFVDGVALNQLVSTSTTLSVSDACEIVRQASIGMQHVYERGSTHRDLKPSNMMLDRNGVVRVLDLGLAKLRADTEDEGKSLTADGQMMGTPDYMAPEQWEDSRSVDIRADIYSLGCTLFCLLAGRPPFGDTDHRSAMAKMRAHASVSAPDIRNLQPDVPDEVALIIQRCLEKSPDQRFATPVQLADALTPFEEAANLQSLVPANSQSADGVNLADQPTHAEAAFSASTVEYEQPASDAKPAIVDQDSSGSKVGFKVAFTRMRQARGAAISTLVGLAVSVGFVLILPQFVGKDRETQRPSAGASGPDEAGPPIITPASANPDSPASNIKVTHFRADANEVRERLGHIGNHEQAIRVNDVVRLNFEMNEDRYVSVIAFNTDGTVQPCVPENESAPHSMTRRGEFPSEPDVYFGLTEGPGQQAFLVLSSTKPLPPFIELLPQLGASGWKHNATGGVWQFDGEHVSQTFVPRVDRGTVKRLTSGVFRTLCLAVKEKLPDCRVTGFAFPVE